MRRRKGRLPDEEELLDELLDEELEEELLLDDDELLDDALLVPLDELLEAEDPPPPQATSPDIPMAPHRSFNDRNKPESAGLLDMTPFPNQVLLG